MWTRRCSTPLHDSILDEAAPSSDAFGAVASGGEATLDQKLDGAIKELEKPSSKAEAAKAADVRVGTPTPVEEVYHNPPVSLLKSAEKRWKRGCSARSSGRRR